MVWFWEIIAVLLRFTINSLHYLISNPIFCLQQSFFLSVEGNALLYSNYFEVLGYCSLSQRIICSTENITILTIVLMFSLCSCQAMMKDQFGNYVVQKVLETCDDQQRELILSRIKVHLNALKKYTYGKHIVARVEKLVAAGGKAQ